MGAVGAYNKKASVMNRLIRSVIIGLFTGLLIAVRAFESRLFYDPLLQFFKTEHTVSALPEMDVAKLYMGLLFRFVLNSLISLTILWCVFKNKSQFKFSAMLYVLFFLICIGVFTCFFFLNAEGPHQFLFYARRFLIQPLLLFLLIPAFYFFGNDTSIEK
jgi:exosortase F-associated protein